MRATVDLDRILAERSDERILQAVRRLEEAAFGRLIERLAHGLQLRPSSVDRSGGAITMVATHLPDGRRYLLRLIRPEEGAAPEELQLVAAQRDAAEADEAILLVAGPIPRRLYGPAEEAKIELGDGEKLVSLIRHFDLEGEVLREGELHRAPPGGPGAVLSPEMEFESNLNWGNEFLSENNPRKALEYFEKALEVRATSDVAWRLKGVALDKAGQHEAAVEAYRKAIELNTTSDENWYSLGTCLFALGRYEEELKCYDQALKYNPQMIKAWTNKGATLHRLGKYEEALVCYNRVLKMNYRLEKVHNNRGVALRHVGRFKEALESYDAAIGLRPDYFDAWLNKANALIETERFREADEALTRVVQLRPEYAQAWYQKGLVLSQLGQRDLAIQGLERALSIEPEFVDARQALANLQAAGAEPLAEIESLLDTLGTRLAPTPAPGKPPAAAAPAPPPPPIAPAAPSPTPAPAPARRVERRVPRAAPPALARAPPTVAPPPPGLPKLAPPAGMGALVEELFASRAEILLTLERGEEAGADLRKALELQPDDAHLRFLFGIALAQQGDLEGAVTAHHAAAHLDPQNPAIWENLVLLNLERGALGEAEEAIRIVRQLVPRWRAAALESLIAAKGGKADRRIETLREAAADGALSEIANALGLALLESGDPGAALEPLAEALRLPLDEVTLWTNQGAAYYLHGMLEEAADRLDRARLQQTVSNTYAWNNLGAVLYSMGRFREAITCFDESLVLRETATAHLNRGFTLLSMDQVDRALEAFERALMVRRSPEGFNDKGIALERLGRHEAAHSCFQEALALAPHFVDARRNLARLEGRLKRGPVPPPGIERAMVPAGAPSIEEEAPQPSAEEPELKCPACGSPVRLSEKTCEACGIPLVPELTAPVTLKAEELRTLKKVELVALCEQRNLEASGTKEELIARLVKWKKSARAAAGENRSAR